MSQLIQPVTDLFHFNSRTVSIALADLRPEDAVYRLKSGAESLIVCLRTDPSPRV